MPQAALPHAPDNSSTMRTTAAASWEDTARVGMGRGDARAGDRASTREEGPRHLALAGDWDIARAVADRAGVADKAGIIN